MKTIVAVIGASSPSEKEYKLAYEVGKLLAQNDIVVLTGGLGGVMEAALKGAKEEGGMVIGIIPQEDPSFANKYVDIVIASGVGDARNAIIANTAQAFIAIGGGLGTLSEIAFALKRSKPVVALSSWKVDEKMIKDTRLIEANSAQQALDAVLKELSSEPL